MKSRAEPEVGQGQGLSRQIHCLAVHPSRPHLCVTGASQGTLAVWDLRMTSAPAVQSAAKPGSGDVLEVGSPLHPAALPVA